MNQSKADKAVMLAKIESINKVDGFDPAPFAVEYGDLNTGEVRYRLPVMIQMAWFRLKYPEGRIAVQVTAAKECFVATAKVYPYYKDPVDCYLAEATASRKPCPDKPSVSAREWAQTAAVGIALRNAGFGLQFSMAGDEFEEIASDELGVMIEENEETVVGTQAASTKESVVHEQQSLPFYEPVAEPSLEERVGQALKKPCPISKYAGKTLGDVLQIDAGAIKWIAEKFKGGEELQSAAKLICEFALQQATA